MNQNSKYYMVRNLQDIRKEKYSSRKAIADVAKVSEKTIERAESGEHRLEYESIHCIANALDMIPEEIIDEKRSNEEHELDELTLREKKKTEPYSKLGMKYYSNVNQVEKKIKVRYMGRSGPIRLSDGDKSNTLFFTTDINKTLDESKIDISINIEENDFLKIVDKLYEEYKDKPLKLQGMDESYLDEKEIELLNKKIISLRLGEEVTLRIIEDEYVEIIDFYPKSIVLHPTEIYHLVESLLCKIANTEKISLRDTIIASGFERIDKIIRCSLGFEGEISQYIKENIEDFLLLREIFICMTYILTGYIDKEISAKEAQNLINNLYKEIRAKLYLLKKLDELYGFNSVFRMLDIMRNKDKIEKSFVMELNI